MEEEASQYVGSVLTTNIAEKVDWTPAKHPDNPCCRKRSLSGANEDESEEQSKKIKTKTIQCDAITVESFDTNALLLQLSRDVKLVAETINHRIDMLEEKISDSEKRITEQVSNNITKVFDKRMSSEMSRMRKDMDNKIGDLLIRNLPFNEPEDIDRKLSDLLRNGLKIQDVNLVKVERKKALSDSTPGVVVAKCNSLEDKNHYTCNSYGEMLLEFLFDVNFAMLNGRDCLKDDITCVRPQ
ncbi:hypothetical protein MAR_003136 [Mya arenaria]|uniref:Uncharacterized protein n=1 Tax=Mya arenaria TaxID=6604 RepID=A0ABY7G557_MYAAR|nr:hypothetical protein MAR_003136 [Mya arenaria]